MSNNNFSKDSFPSNGWQDLFSSSNIVGFEYPASITKYIKYRYVGKNIVQIVVRLDGISNSSTTSFTLPFIFQSPSLIKGLMVVPLQVANNNVSIWGQLTITPDPKTGGLLCTATQGSSSTWTASGIKHIRGEFFLPI